MSETKRVEYKRKTCTDALKEVLQHAVDINSGKADYPYYNKIKELILFGSYVNTDKDYLHDIDFCIIFDRDHTLSRKFNKEHPEVFHKFDWFNVWHAEFELQHRYLRGRRKMVTSLHSNIYEGEEIKDIATSDKHIVLISGHTLTKEGLALLKGESA